MKYRLIIDKDFCKGCALCVTACPKDVLAMSTNLNRKGVRIVAANKPESCIGCRQCADICPEAAIEIEIVSADRKKPG